MDRPDNGAWIEAVPRPLRWIGGVVVLLALAGVVAFGVLRLTGALDDERVDPNQIRAAAVDGGTAEDPFAWDPSRREDLERRARLGYSHVLYELSPGGALATARRTARYRDQIERIADEYGVSADLMEAMVFLESAGRPEVIAGGSDPANASGLAQIVASTGIALLEMPIDLPRSQELTAQIADSLIVADRLRERARRFAQMRKRRDQRRAAPLLRRAGRAERNARVAQRERARVDPRFDPEAALEGMARYLQVAASQFGREDLAVTSYHMGIGNLGNVIAAYVGPEQAGAAARELVAEQQLSYARLFFDSSPTLHPQAWEILGGLGDDSATYYWRVLAALEIMRLFRSDREVLKRLITLHGNKATAEEVFHPEDRTPVFDDPAELRDGVEAGELVQIPNGRPYGFRVSPQLGEFTGELGLDRSLYRALRPEALAALIYMAGRVQAITRKTGPKQDLIVTSAVRDLPYQRLLVGRNGEATPAYSLHTTGYSFDILREYASDRQARAFQFVLDRLKALGVIDYAREPRAIHVTVSDLAQPLLG